jgi:hypothetical protein
LDALIEKKATKNMATKILSITWSIWLEL